MKNYFFVLFLLLLLSCKNEKKESSNSNTEIKSDSVSVENTSVNAPTDYAPQSVNDSLAEKIAAYLRDDYLKDDIDILDTSERKFQLYEIDLNEDGQKEVFINFMTRYFCGTGGCSMLLLNSELSKITNFSVMNPPLFVEKIKKNGWRILLIKDRGELKELVYKDGSYPSNPSVLPKAPYDAPSGHAEILFDENYSKPKTYNF
ncbi:hypothetical protein HX109_12195 [Galbibacter sp. BG1]|uniref:hypothetical protein n=1 Tax=Galbibacter sp. BG1 TaxID=1170699 RepID=UPI0015BD1B32|nr:hypothetical protein [Galbibacter sp. BG1]QLE02281.1 hypothetical protein HX109_12195 [Galbibacter sp. BG1]